MDVTFRETSASERTSEVALGHLSIEVGHVYSGEHHTTTADLRKHFQQLVPWLNSAALAAVAGVPEKSLRKSTCFLIDDLSRPLSMPSEVLPDVLAAAAQAGVTIDYIVRESACVDTGGVDLSELVVGMLVPDPPVDTTGSRPPHHESGWLCNGVRSPSTSPPQAMAGASGAWKAPCENAARSHSVFLDVELWTDKDNGRQWSCSFLAAVWQLLRLGLLRGDDGKPPMVPVPIDDIRLLPDRWSDLPPLIQVNKKAWPFSAYRTLSVIPSGFLPVEHAVRTVLEQVAVNPTALGHVLRRGEREGITLPPESVDRISYVLLNP